MITSFSGEYEFLSNFFGVPGGIVIIPHQGIALRVPTVEHGFQALKAVRFEQCLEIARAATPGRAKRLGQKCELRPNWNSIRVVVMRELLVAKFSVAPLDDKLLSTGDEVLVEGNKWGDMFWGCVLLDRVWVGENQLGKLLMEIRKELQDGKLL